MVRAVISVTDAERSLLFYRDVLGLPAESRGPGMVALTLPDGVEVVLHQRPSTPSPAGIAVTFGVDDVDAVTTAATAAGCTVLRPPTDEAWGERQSVVTDPDGHVICLIQRAGRPQAGPLVADDADSRERAFGWWDMFAAPEDDPRADGGFENTERAMLVGYLSDRRLTLQLKCSGLGADDMALRSVPPSDLSLLGLLRHLADVERTWFRIRLAGQQVPLRYRTDEDANGDFTAAVPDPGVVEEAWTALRAEIAFAERYVEQSPDLGAVGAQGDYLREVLVHMIEEYARHNGHADFLRERIDGRVGQ